MLLATQCPHCKTTFKVANDQLKLQSGLVRCGICHQVFNGIEHLADTDKITTTSTIKINPPVIHRAALAEPDTQKSEQDEVPSKVQPEPTPAATKPDELEFDLFDAFDITLADDAEKRIEPTFDLGHDAPEPAVSAFPSLLNDEFHQAQTKAEIEAKVQALLDADLQADQQLSHGTAVNNADDMEEIILAAAVSGNIDFDETKAPATPLPPAKRAANLRSMLPGAAEDDVDEEFDEQRDDEDHEEHRDHEDEEIGQLSFIRKANAKKRMVWILAVATVLLCFLLIGQAVYQFRDLIAAAYPPVKNTLVTMCKLARCQIQLPAQLDAVSYEADELHTLAHDNTFEFSLLMRNHSALPQAWPNIELTLKDPQKQAVLKKVFAPADYLPNPHDVLTGFAANQEQPIKLYFVVDKVTASDYVMAIYYP